jgi:DNA-directed RNA polymerase specialized sigma24 family protein
MARRPPDERRLSAIGLARLLTRLDPDARRAPAEYVRLRRTLVRFFDLRGAWPPEECADECLDRLARRLETGTGEPAIEDVRRYAHGIARLVLLERLRTPAPVSISDDDLENLAAPVPSADGNPRQECFDCCLSAQPEEHRTLALQYYVAEGQAKIDNRRGLARALGITENALRRRVQRIRERLEQCMTNCTAEAAALGIDAAARRVLATHDTLHLDGPDDA